MKRLQRRWVVGVVFVFLVAVSMWFAAPTIAAVNQHTGSPVAEARQPYEEPGAIIILKVDINTHQIINEPGVAFSISPNPYNPGPYGPGDLVVTDNVSPDTDSSNGHILVPGVISGVVYTIHEVVAPPGYQVDTGALFANVQPGQTATVTSSDRAIGLIPASSNTTLWIMIAIFGTLICSLILWRSRHAQISRP